MYTVWGGGGGRRPRIWIGKLISMKNNGEPEFEIELDGYNENGEGKGNGRDGS